MLHNSYFHILKFYTQDINRDIYGRMLIGKIPLSPKAIANALNDLEDQGVLKSRRQGNIKFFNLNKDNKLTFDIMVSVEILKKIEFLSENIRLKHIFGYDERIVGIFGSYAKKTQKVTSDLDVFIIGDKGFDYVKLGKQFDLDVSVKYFKEFNTQNPLIKEIAENHIIMNGFEEFMKLLWR